MRERANNLHEDEKRIKKELEAIATERQWTITQARKGGITTTDMEGQLSILTMQELNLKTELASLGQAISTDILINWEAKFNEYLEDLRAGIEELKNAAPETPEERHRVFLLKKKVVDVVLEEAPIDENKEIHVKIPVCPRCLQGRHLGYSSGGRTRFRTFIFVYLNITHRAIDNFINTTKLSSLT